MSAIDDELKTGHYRYRVWQDGAIWRWEAEASGVEIADRQHGDCVAQDNARALADTACRVMARAVLSARRRNETDWESYA